MTTRPPALAANGVPRTKSHSRRPIGTIDATVTPATTVIGRSRSVRSRRAPLRRLRVLATASVMPRTMGPMILISVQTAATAMVPAPMNRTSWENTPCTASAMEPVPGS